MQPCLKKQMDAPLQTEMVRVGGLCTATGTTVPDVLSAHHRGPAITRLRWFRRNYASRRALRAAEPPERVDSPGE